MDDVRITEDHRFGYALEDLAIGMTAAYEQTVTAADIRAFADITGDHNPLHLDEDFARKTRFGGCIAHGMLSAGFISTAVATLPGPGTIYLSQSLAFRAPVRAGDHIVARVTVTEILPEKKRVRLATSCSVGDTVVVDGEAVVMVRSRG